MQDGIEKREKERGNTLEMGKLIDEIIRKKGTDSPH